MSQRPGVKRGADVPDEFKFKEVLRDHVKIREFEEMGRRWVMEGMERDAEDGGRGKGVGK